MHIPTRLDRTLLNIIKGSLLLVLFLPLFVYEQFLFPFVFPRTIVFRVLVEISSVAWILLSIRNPQYRFRWKPLTAGFTVFIAVLTLTAATGISPYHSFWSTIERSEGILTWLHLLLYFLLLADTIRDREEWMEFFKTAILAGALQTIYAFGEYFQLGFALETAGARVSGAIGNPSFLAPYLMAMIAIAITLIAETKQRWLQGLYTIFIASNLFLIWQTQTRGAILGTAVGALIMLTYAIARRWSWKIAIAVVIGMLMLSAGAFITLRTTIADTWIAHYPTLQRLVSISPNDITTQNRLIVWGAGIEAVQARPLLGWGLENFSIPFTIYFNPDITRDIGSHPWYDRAHNTLIEITVASGILGLASYLVLWGIAIVLLMRKGGSLTSLERNVIASFLAGYFLQNLFVFDTLNSYIIWLLILAYIQFRSSPPMPSDLPAKRTRLLPVAIVSLLFLIPCLYYFNVRPVLANLYVVDASVRQKENPSAGMQRFKEAFSYSPPSEEEYRFVLIQYTRDQINLRGITPETKPLVEFAIAEMQKTIAARPLSVQNDLLLSELYLAATDLDPEYLGRAEAMARQALTKAPRRYQTYTLLGRIKVSQGDYPAAIDYFKQAIALNERFAETHWNLAVAYILARRADESIVPLTRAAELGYPVYEQGNVEKLLGAYRDSQDLQATIAFLERLHNDFPENETYTKLLEELSAFYEEALRTLKEQAELTSSE